MAKHFVSGPVKTSLTAANLNSLDRGGNVWESAVGGLKVDISGMFIAKHASASLVEYAGETELALTDSATNYIYLDSSGVRHVSTSSFPASFSATPYVPLAAVVCAGAVIVSINDKRPAAWLP